MVSPARNLPPREPEPAWDIARLYPDQGYWPELEYLIVTHSTNKLVEFTDGYVEVLPMPKMSHQLIVAYLYAQMLSFVSARDLGRLLFAPFRVRLRPSLIREPDIVFMLKEHAARMHEDYWDGADLVIEVVSDDPDSRHRDLEEKRLDYAAGHIPEYWIVDLIEQRITVLRLEGEAYVVHAEAMRGSKVTSNLLSGFELDVTRVLDSGGATAS